MLLTMPRSPLACDSRSESSCVTSLKCVKLSQVLVIGSVVCAVSPMRAALSVTPEPIYALEDSVISVTATAIEMPLVVDGSDEVPACVDWIEVAASPRTPVSESRLMTPTLPDAVIFGPEPEATIAPEPSGATAAIEALEENTGRLSDSVKPPRETWVVPCASVESLSDVESNNPDGANSDRTPPLPTMSDIPCSR